MFAWKKYDEATIQKTHGNLSFYRDLYEGNHEDLFPRARELKAKGEVTVRLAEGGNAAERVKSPYIIANMSKIIPEITATFVSRSIGTIRSGLKVDEQANAAANADTNEQIDEAEGAINEQIVNLHDELIKQIAKNSNLGVAEHWSNVVQQQVDGGLLGIAWKDENGVTIEFKARDCYFPHPDGKGADLVEPYDVEDENGKEQNYLRVYRERIEDGSVIGKHMLFSVSRFNNTKPLDDEVTMEILGIDSVDEFFEGRSTSMMQYWANDKTFMNPLGSSVLKGQESKQDEINWLLTQQGIIFTRNGKPRIAVTKEVMSELQRLAVERYGEGNEHMVDADDLELTTLDDDGNALQVIQIDISKIGTIDNVKNLMKLMLMETQTSEKAVDFYMEGGAGATASGVAKYYDLLMTLIKSQRIAEEYTHFLQNLFTDALWLMNQDDEAVQVEPPEILSNDMIPLTKKEVLEMNASAFVAKIQSLETTLRNIYPTASDKWIEDEMTRIEQAMESDDSSTLTGGRDFISAYMDGRTERGGANAQQNATSAASGGAGNGEG